MRPVQLIDFSINRKIAAFTIALDDPQ